MVSELETIKISKFGRILLVGTNFDDHNSDTLQFCEVEQQFSESTWNVLFSNMLGNIG